MALSQEKEKNEMIQEALSVEKMESGKREYIEEYNRCYKRIEDLYTYEKNEGNFRNIESVQIIPLPVYEQNMEKIQELEKELKKKDLVLSQKIQLEEIRSILYLSQKFNIILAKV